MSSSRTARRTPDRPAAATLEALLCARRSVPPCSPPALLAGAPATTAHAQPEPLPTGGGCGRFFSVGQEAIDGGRQHGLVYGGPLAAAALPPPADPLATPVSVTLTCTLHVWGPTPDPAIASSGSGTAVAVVAPTAVSFTATDEDDVVVCASAVLTDAHGTTYTYYESTDNGMWYPFPVTCSNYHCLELGPDCDHTLALLLWVVDHESPYLQDVDDTVCPELASLSPGIPGVVDIDPTGDTYAGGQFVWDCPPYAAG